MKKKQLSFKGISWLLILALLALPLVSVRPVPAEPGCVDEWSGTVYERGEDCPPQELLNTTRPNSKERSDLLDHWFNKLDKSTRDAYRLYVECSKALAETEKQLARAKAEKSIREVEYEQARDNLKRLLVAAMARLGVGTAVISIDAAANLYLAGKSLKEAIAGSQRKKSPEEIETQRAEAAEQQRLVSEAAKRQQYVGSLEQSLAAAEQRVAAAEARQTAAAGRGGAGPERPAGLPGEKPPAGAPGAAEAPAPPPKPQRSETPPARPAPPETAPRPTNASTPERYAVTDPTNPRFQAFASVETGGNYLDGGEIVMTLRTELRDGAGNLVGKSEVLKGHEEFANILSHLRGRFKGVRGSWSYGTNLERFNKLTARGTPPEQAALGTWTGQQAAGHGYTKVLVRRLEGTPGNYTKVEVTFTLPD